MRYTVLTFIFIVNLFSYQVGDRYKNEVIELKEELSIGVADGAEEYILNRPVDIDADSKGNIYVADGGDKWIKVYNSDGTFIKTIGREGQGPGEFQGLRKIIVHKKDELYTYDSRLRRLSLFDKNDEFIKSFSLSVIDQYIGGFFIDDKDRFILIGYPRIPDLDEDR